jgi:hypothetical protein
MAECCDDMSEALQDGTDNEQYLALININDKDQYEVGTYLQHMKYCCWCGTRLTIDDRGNEP